MCLSLPLHLCLLISQSLVWRNSSPASALLSLWLATLLSSAFKVEWSSVWVWSGWNQTAAVVLLEKQSVRQDLNLDNDITLINTRCPPSLCLCSVVITNISLPSLSLSHTLPVAGDHCKVRRDAWHVREVTTWRHAQVNRRLCVCVHWSVLHDIKL